MEFHGSPLFAVLTAANAEETDNGRGERMGGGGGIGQKKFRVRRFLSVLQRDDPHRDEGIVQRRRISFGKKYISRSSRFFDVVKKLGSFALSSIFFVFF